MNSCLFQKELVEMDDLRASRTKAEPVQGRTLNSTNDLISFDAGEDLGPSDAESDIDL